MILVDVWSRAVQNIEKCIRRCGLKKDEAGALSGAEARRTLMLHLADELADRGLGLRIPKQPTDTQALADSAEAAIAPTGQLRAGPGQPKCF